MYYVVDNLSNQFFLFSIVCSPGIFGRPIFPWGGFFYGPVEDEFFPK